MICTLIFIVALLQYAKAVPIDNGVEGDPEIECGASTITINFNIRNNFEGKVYVRGHTSEDGCFSVERGRKVAGLNLQFTSCGVERARSLNPRGVFVTASVVISFHPQFVTKVDRAYTIQCFYMEAEKTVSQQIEVSELSTLFQSQIAPMPVCRYDILDNGPTGQPVKFALIGQQVYHKWTCDTDTTDIFCMIVHTCFVDDGAGNRVQILNDDGCGLDKHILQNLEYTTDLMAGRESHVFKFADRAGLFFQCQISVTTKEPGAQCPRPQCGEPTGITGPGAGLGAAPTGNARAPPGTLPPRPIGTGGTRLPTRGTQAPTLRPLLTNRTRLRFFDLPLNADRRAKRSAPWLDDEIGVWDVRSNHITTFDLDDSENPFQKSSNSEFPTPKPFAPALASSKVDQVFCLSPPVFGLTIAFSIASVVSVVALSVLFFRTKRTNSDYSK